MPRADETAYRRAPKGRVSTLILQLKSEREFWLLPLRQLPAS
jgi:hypothetical protein